jgi:uncharacterized protein YbjQ (UPF0145 family)
MKKYLVLLLVVLLAGCYAGKPYLNAEQEQKAYEVRIVKLGESQAAQFNILGDVKAADCTGKGGTRIKGQEELAIEALKAQTVMLGGDTVIDVACTYAPFVNNCWAAAVCSGKAATIKK